ncbi:MAG: tetratricopeptide repeat protein [Pyrinomonadaceae bacterium]
MKLETVATNDEELRVMLESGLVLREAGRLDEAETIFQGIRELVPQSNVPLVALSSIAARRGDFEAALRLCEEALRHEPSSLFARVNRAEILLYQKRRGEAETELREIIEIAPESPHSRTAQSLLNVAQMIPETA